MLHSLNPAISWNCYLSELTDRQVWVRVRARSDFLNFPQTLFKSPECAMLVTIPTTKQQNTHRKFGNKRAKSKVSKNTQRKTIDKQRTKKQTNNNNNNHGRFFFSIFLKGVERTGWASLLAGLARPGGSVCRACLLAALGCSVLLLLLSFSSCSGNSEKGRNDAGHDVRRNTRHEFQDTHSHTLTHTLLFPHYQGTTNLPFNLVGTKTNLNLLVTLVVPCLLGQWFF